MSTYDEMKRKQNASSDNKPKKRVAFTDKEYIYMEISDEEMERMLRRPGAKRLDTAAAKKPIAKAPVRKTSSVSDRRNEMRDKAIKEYFANDSESIVRKVKERKKPIFWICLGVYAAILIILGIIFLNYTDKCLKQYEDAQPNHMMDTVLADIQSKVSDGSIVNEINLPSGGGVFESSDIYGQSFLASVQGKTEYTYEKDPSSYNTEAPIYDIFADGTMMAKVTLASSNERTIFGILTIMDWSVESIEPVLNLEAKNYTITVPSIYSVAVNGVNLTDEYIVENNNNPDYANVSEYVSMPTDVVYEVSGLYNEPVINITDRNGNISQAAIIDGKATMALSGSDIPEDRRTMVFDIAKTWQDFMTNDLAGNSHGLGTVRQYLIKDSYYYNLATSYAGGVDITFMSAHRVDGYTEPVIDEYVEYSDVCFSCHISYVKNMTLTRNGDQVTDEIDSTFYFVYYDDSDDGVDNPHWAMVDMIAKTH